MNTDVEQSPWTGERLRARAIGSIDGDNWFPFEGTCRDLDIDPEVARSAYLRPGQVALLQAPEDAKAPVEAVSETGLIVLLQLSLTVDAMCWHEWFFGKALPELRRMLPLIRAADQLGCFDTSPAAPPPASREAGASSVTEDPVQPLGSVSIFTDGACCPNPGQGGWAAIIRDDAGERVISGRDPGMTTNNAMELTAAIRALEAVPPGTAGTLFSDSEYVVKAITAWLPGWKAKGWKKADGKPVLNKGLLMRLDDLVAERKVAFKWVRGHAGHPENERVDALANAEAEKAAAESGGPPAGNRFGFGPKAA